MNGLLQRALLRVLPVSALVMLAIGTVSSRIVETTFTGQTHAHMAEDARFAARAVSSKLTAVLSSVRSVAANDLVINGLVDVDAREGYVPLYFNQLRVAGLRSGGKITFTDYRGRVIASNWEAPNFADAPWLSKVIDDGEEYLRFDDAGAHFAVPVLYQGSPEGAIVVEFGRDKLAELLALSVGTQAALVSTLHDDIFASNDEFARAFRSGTAERQGWLQSYAEVAGYPGIQVTVAEKSDVAFAPVVHLKKALIVALALALVALTAGAVLTAYLTTSPIKTFALQLKSFRGAEDLDRRIRATDSLEFNDLADSFNAMLDRLQKVVVSHDALARENEFRRQAEEQLHKQNERFNIALENMSQGLCVFDDRRIVVCNTRYGAMYGLTPDQVKPGTSLEEIVRHRIEAGIHAGASPEAYMSERMDWGASSGEAKTCVQRLSDGRLIRISRAPLTNGGWVATHDVITDGMDGEESKRELLAFIDEELRTPLRSLVESLRLVNAGSFGVLPDLAGPLVEDAYRDSETLKRLVDDMLDVEGLTTDDMAFGCAVTDVVALARRAIETTAAFGDLPGVRLRLEEDLGAAYAEVDADRILQVLASFLSEAARSAEPDSDVVLRLSREDASLRLAVIFRQAPETLFPDSDGREGSGLGLAIAEGIVKKHGSEVRHASEPASGSTFSFDLVEIGAPALEDVGNEPEPELVYV